MNYLKLKLTAIKYHRNGISGVGFYVILFDWIIQKPNGGPVDSIRHMVATVYDEPGYCAVHDVADLVAGNVVSAWRGDNFEPQLRKFIKNYDKSLAKIFKKV